jgi:hypothetical protein
MVLAVVVMAAVRALTGQPVTLLIFAAVLAMISNLAVNEPDLSRRRATTALMILPAAVAVTAGTLFAPHRLVADVVFVAVTMAAVYVRRFGPRGFAQPTVTVGSSPEGSIVSAIFIASSIRVSTIACSGTVLITWPRTKI